MNNNIIKLPLIETVTRSFMYVIKNITTVSKISSIFLLLWFAEMLAGFPFLCSTDNAFCTTNISHSILAILLYISSAIISISVIRNIILKQEYNFFHISAGFNLVKYIGYQLLIAVMIIIPSTLILMISQASQSPDLSIFTKYFLGAAFITTLIGLSIFCFRLYLVFAGSAINDKEMTLGRSYTLTKGNMLSIFAGQVILALPTIILLGIIFSLYPLSNWGFIGNSIFVLAGLLCTFFDAAIKGSYYSHIYQYFMYYAKQDQ